MPQIVLDFLRENLVGGESERSKNKPRLSLSDFRVASREMFFFLHMRKTKSQIRFSESMHATDYRSPFLFFRCM